MHNREVVEQVSIGYRIPCPKTCPDQIYYDVQLRCWDKEPGSLHFVHLKLRIIFQKNGQHLTICTAILMTFMLLHNQTIRLRNN